MSKSWGYHLILDCKSGREIRSKEDLWAFVIQLVEEIDMVSYGQPMIEHFPHTMRIRQVGVSFN